MAHLQQYGTFRDVTINATTSNAFNKYLHSFKGINICYDMYMLSQNEYIIYMFTQYAFCLTENDTSYVCLTKFSQSDCIHIIHIIITIILIIVFVVVITINILIAILVFITSFPTNSLCSWYLNPYQWIEIRVRSNLRLPTANVLWIISSFHQDYVNNDNNIQNMLLDLFIVVIARVHLLHIMY